MATTTNGLPYPLGTDLVVNGDDAIKALAEKVDQSVLPFGYVRARCTTTASHGAAAWNIAQMDVLADARGAQPWTLEAGSRRLKILKAGVYSLAMSLTTAGGVPAVGIAISPDGVAWDRIASAPIGTINYTNVCATIRYLPANTYVVMMFYTSATLSVVADAANSPTYLAVQALGGQV